MKSSAPGGSFFPRRLIREKSTFTTGLVSLLIATLRFRQAGKHERRNNGNALARLHHGDHGVEIIEDGAPMNENPGAGQMLVDELLNRHCPAPARSAALPSERTRW